MAERSLFENIYQGKKVLVTGDTGFKGTWLTLWLLELGADVYGIAKGLPSSPAMFEVLGLHDRIKHYDFDIQHMAPVVSTIGDIQPDFVFHLAAQPIVRTSYENPIETFGSNVMGTAHVLEGLRQSGHPCNAVLITSDKAYDNSEWVWGYRETDRLGGKDPYSASKGAAELVIKAYYKSYFQSPDSPVRLAVGRAGNVVGGGDWAANRLVPDCFRLWGNHQPVEIRNPDSTRPWQHVLEALSGYLHLGQQLATTPKINGEAYNFGPRSAKSYTVMEVIEAMRKHWKAGQDKNYVNYGLEKGYREDGLLKLNCDKVEAQLGWHAVLNLEELAQFTTEWYYAFYIEKQANMYTVSAQQISQYVDLAAERDLPWVTEEQHVKQLAF